MEMITSEVASKIVGGLNINLGPILKCSDSFAADVDGCKKTVTCTTEGKFGFTNTTTATLKVADAFCQ